MLSMTKNNLTVCLFADGFELQGQFVPLPEEEEDDDESDGELLFLWWRTLPNLKQKRNQNKSKFPDY